MPSSDVAFPAVEPSKLRESCMSEYLMGSLLQALSCIQELFVPVMTGNIPSMKSDRRLHALLNGASLMEVPWKPAYCKRYRNISPAERCIRLLSLLATTVRSSWFYPAYLELYLIEPVGSRPQLISKKPVLWVKCV